MPENTCKSASFFMGAARYSLYALFLLLPIFFLPITVDILEINKQTLLVFLTLLGTLSWLIAMVCGKTLAFRKGWLNILPPILFAVILLSAIFSEGPYLSWIGTTTEEYASILSLIAFTLLFYLIANTLVTEKSHRAAHFYLLSSGVIAGLLGLIGLFDWSVAGKDFFNTIGTLNGFVVYLALMAVYANALWVTHARVGSMMYQGWRGVIELILVFALNALALAVLVTTDFLLGWIVLLVGLTAVLIFTVARRREIDHYARLILPLVLLIITLPFLFFVNDLVPFSAPAEISLTHGSSLEIATKVIEEGNALFGSGPGTYLFDYTRYRSEAINTSPFWDLRFDRASSFMLTMLPTVGILGAAAWIVFLLGTFIAGLVRLLTAKSREDWAGIFVLTAPFLALGAALFLYTANITLLFLLFTFAGLIGSQLSKGYRVITFRQSPKLGLLFSALVVLAAVGLVSGLFVTVQRYGAEVAYAAGVRAEAGAPLEEIIEDLDTAAQRNRFHDTYYRTLAQALLLKVGEELDSENLTELTPERRQFIQALTGASVNAAVRATDLSPFNVSNWTVRGAIYRELIPIIGNAGNFSLEAFEHATELEPLNPANYVELGKVYMMVAETERPLTAAQDPQVKAEAEGKIATLLASAEESFLKAVELKQDYAPAHYQLALVFERQGRLDDAVGKMEVVAQFNQLDVGVAFQLGLLYLRRGGEGDLARAANAFEQAVTLSPSYANARWFLASVYEQQGNFNGAIEQILKVLETNPENQLVRSRLERLQQGSAPPAEESLPPELEEGEPIIEE